MSENVIISTEPATGAELWRGEIGDVDAAVDRARRAWPAWAAQPLANRIELVRRFANEVRKEQDAFAELIARETGKPLWESHTEVEAIWSAIADRDDWQPLEDKIAAVRRMGEALGEPPPPAGQPVAEFGP